MKIRLGFVGNSSTSSYTCAVCGRNEAFPDSGDKQEYGFVSCENGHDICEEHAMKEITAAQKKEYLVKMEYSERVRKLAGGIDIATEEGREAIDELFEGEAETDILAPQCPICTMVKFSPDDLLAYIYQKVIPKEDLAKKIREDFPGGYFDFVKAVKPRRVPYETEEKIGADWKILAQDEKELDEIEIEKAAEDEDADEDGDDA